MRERIDWDLLQRRFPKIALLLMYGEDEGLELRQEREWSPSFSRDVVDVLCVYGIGLGRPYRVLTSWLEEKSERSIVFIEESLSVLRELFSLPVGTEMLKNSRVIVHYCMDTASLDDVFNQTACRQIHEQVAFVAYDFLSEKKEERLRSKLLRRAEDHRITVTEMSYYSMIMENVRANFFRMPDSFDIHRLKGVFRGVPAVICGAGCSLAEASVDLKRVGGKALLFGCGSAVTALGRYGVRPHVAVAVDPNEEEYERLKTSTAFEVPFAYASRLHKDVLGSLNVRPGHVYTEDGGPFEDWMHDRVHSDRRSFASRLEPGAFSVTTLAVPLAIYLGCDPVFFCGVDLAYRGNDRYPTEVSASSSTKLDTSREERSFFDKAIRRKNSQKKDVYTLMRWVIEGECLASYVKRHKKVRFFNGSFSGLPIKNVSVLSLSDFLKEYCLQEYDLEGRLFAETQTACFDEDVRERLSVAEEEFTCSMRECLKISREMTEEIENRIKIAEDLNLSPESGKMILRQEDFQAQPAYTACLKSIGIGKIFTGERRPDASQESVEGRLLFLQGKKREWESHERTISDWLNSLPQEEIL